MWWLLLPAAAIVGKVVYDALTKEEKPSYTPPAYIPPTYTPPAYTPPVAPRQVHFDVRGDFEGKSVLVIGRTGAGKSSLINMLRGEQVLEVGVIGSTTRWIEGVPCCFDNQKVTLVDSPGVGEAYTNDEYNRGIEEWFAKSSGSVACILLVIQADSKAHSEDKRLLDSLVCISVKPIIIALNQSDKITPIRESFTCDDWETDTLSRSEKGRHITDKIAETARQFGYLHDPIHIVPVASASGAYFNRTAMIRTIKAYM
jgi:small GTP-binding protein